MTLSGHSNHVTSLCLFNNGRYLASGSYDKTIKIWNVDEGVLLTSMNHTAEILDLVVLNQVNLISSSFDNHITMWDVKSGKTIKQFILKSNPVIIKALRNTRQFSVYLLDLIAITLHPRHLTCLVELSNGDLVFSTHLGYIVIWNHSTNDFIEFKTKHCRITSLCVLDQIHLGVGFADGSIHVWNLRFLTMTRTLNHHTKWISALLIYKNEYLVSGSRDKMIVIWDWRNGNMKQILDQNPSPVTAMAVVQNGLLASASEDFNIKIWK